MLSDRRGIIVWLNSIKHAKHLRRYGNVLYVSKRLKYVVMYCDTNKVDEVSNKIQSLKYVKKVEPSYRPLIQTEFDSKKPDKAKEYDYKLGF